MKRCADIIKALLRDLADGVLRGITMRCALYFQRMKFMKVRQRN